MQLGILGWIKRLPDPGDVIKRFPVSAAIMAIFTAIIIYQQTTSRIDEQVARLLCGLVISAYLAFCLVIAKEVKNALGDQLGGIYSPAIWIFVKIIIAIVVTTLAYFSEGLRLNIFMGLGAVLLVLGNMVLWRSGKSASAEERDIKNIKVWDFTHKIWSGAVFATVGSIIFFIGMMVITETLRALFGLNMRGLIHDIILPFGLGFLAPLFWLSTIPPVNEDHAELYSQPDFVSKSVAFMGTWLLVPLTLIYALILLAYGVKIALAGQLPDGEIASMTLPFLFVGTLTWLLLYPPFARSNRLARIFRTTWFYASLPAAILLAISVWVRISGYGLTPERIALAMAVIWALGLAIWYILAPKRLRDIRFIPGSAAALLFIGTLLAGRASIYNQAGRFEAGLAQSGVISADGTIVKDDDAITNMEAARKAKSALGYLHAHNGRDIADKILNKYAFNSTESEGLSDQLSTLGLSDVAEVAARDQHIHYMRASNQINIDGYDRIYQMARFTTSANHDVDVIRGDNFKIEQQGLSLLLYHHDEEISRYELTDMLADFRLEGSTVSLNKNGYIIYDRDEKRVKLIINTASPNRAVLASNSTQPESLDWRLTLFVLTQGFDNEP